MNELMDNGTQQVLAELLNILLSVIGIIATYYVNKWLSTNATAKKYELDKIITEDLVNDAIIYAEDYGRRKGLKGILKKEIANRYIDEMNPKLVRKLGSRMGKVIDKQVAKKFNK